MARSKKINLTSFTQGPPNFKHFQTLTDNVGIIQHSQGPKPDLKFGYSIDDNARALVVALIAFHQFGDQKFLKFAQIYLEFIQFMQKSNGLFHNFLSKNKKYEDFVGSQDSFARTIWALGFAIWAQIDNKISKKAEKIFQKGFSHISGLVFPRSQSYAILGLSYYFKAKKDPEAKKILTDLGDNLVYNFKETATENWSWFENELTYCNAIIPLGLFLAYEISKKANYLQIAQKSFDFLLKTCQLNKIPSAIGQAGWYFKDSEKTLYDQQPVDPALMVQCSLKAFEITKAKKYFQEAKNWFLWFWGNNLGQKILIAKNTGGCYDGLKKGKFNPNQGAEGCLEYLLAYLEMRKFLGQGGK